MAIDPADLKSGSGKLYKFTAKIDYVLVGSRRDEILERRKEAQIQTINRCRDYNQGLRKFANAT